MYIDATPAYGRDYTNQKAVKADWDAGKDFHTLQGYISKDYAKANGIKVVIYYDNRRKQIIL